MSNFKIYGTPYELSKTSSVPADAFGYKGDIVYDKPKGRNIGYITMEDGSVIECYKSFNPLIIVTPLMVALTIVGGLSAYFLLFQDKDVVIGDTPIKVGDDANVVSYNGFMQLTNDSLSVNFQNGDYPCTLTVTGEGVESTEIQVQPGEYVASVPCTFTTEDGLVRAVLTVKTETSTMTNEVMVEIPSNNTDNSPNEGMSGYWEGENIYGVSPAE